MHEIKTISWRELTGNRFSRLLHPAMLANEGYTYTMRIRRTGDTTQSVFQVIYDREYVIEVLTRKFLKPFSNQKKETIDQLVEDAWDLYNKNAIVPSSYN